MLNEPALADLDPRFRPAVEWIVAVARAYLGGCTISSTRRGVVKQAWLYYVKYADRGQVCPPGTSTHELGWAADITVAAGSSSRDQAWLGAVWNHYVVNTWRAADPVHFAGSVGCLSK